MHSDIESEIRFSGLFTSLEDAKVLKLFKQTNNTLLKIGILNALNEIGVPEAKEFILKVTDSDVGIIKIMAKEIINRGF